MTDQYSDDNVLAIANDEGVWINGTLLPWSTVSMMSALEDLDKQGFVPWLQYMAMSRTPDGTEVTGGDMMATSARVRDIIDSVGDKMPAELKTIVDSLADVATDLSMSVSLEEAGFPIEDAQEPQPKPLTEQEKREQSARNFWSGR